MRRVAGGSNALAVDLYNRLAKGDGNLVFSPYSTSAALAMAYAGARGETARQMAKALHLYLPQETLHPAYRALNQRLTGLSGGQPRLTLQLADSLWVEKTCPIKPAYETLRRTTGQRSSVDFHGEAQAFDAIDSGRAAHAGRSAMTPPSGGRRRRSRWCWCDVPEGFVGGPFLPELTKRGLSLLNDARAVPLMQPALAQAPLLDMRYTEGPGLSGG
jgi:serpin B